MRSLRKPLIFAFVTVVLAVSTRLLSAIGANADGPITESSAPDALADLDQRISKLEKVGPLVITDNAGKAIFKVAFNAEANGAQVVNSKGSPVAMIGAHQDGGYFQATDSTNDSKGTTIGFADSFSGIFFNEKVTEEKNGEMVSKYVTRLNLGKKIQGNYALKVLTGDGEMIAGIGESKAGSGAIVIGNSKGSLRAAFSVANENKGLIDIVSAEGNSVASFGEASGNTGGSLVLGNKDGEPRVKMGTNALRYGVVLTLPPGMPYVTKTGLPGSYMLGCAGGPSCVP
jgi:hypothetical protein